MVVARVTVERCIGKVQIFVFEGGSYRRDILACLFVVEVAVKLDCLGR